MKELDKALQRITEVMYNPETLIALHAKALGVNEKYKVLPGLLYLILGKLLHQTEDDNPAVEEKFDKIVDIAKEISDLKEKDLPKSIRQFKDMARTDEELEAINHLEELFETIKEETSKKKDDEDDEEDEPEIIRRGEKRDELVGPRISKLLNNLETDSEVGAFIARSTADLKRKQKDSNK